ncbi:helix-turn-helix domain-containing protein [Mycobacterium sp. 94-17]|nr:helix-turn-helix domain-containing protein [Mycobacterium sp. 94-17]
MPDGCVDLFVNSRGEAMVAGPATTFYDLYPDGSCLLAGVRLRPGAASAILGQPISDFTDHRVTIDAILGTRGSGIGERVVAATSAGQRVAALQELLTGYLAASEPLPDAAVTRAIRTVQRDPDLPVSSLAASVDLSERQLRRRFVAAVGYGPKRFGRIVRFQRLLDLIHARGTGVRWAELAVEADYTDQSHMINECRALAGMSPVALPGGGAGVSVSSNT